MFFNKTAEKHWEAEKSQQFSSMLTKNCDKNKKISYQNVAKMRQTIS